jgi:hypothetical protein
MGDDRVRIYANDGTGRYQIQREVPLPEGMTPLCLGRNEVRGVDILTVFLQPADSPTERVVWFGEGEQFRFESTAGNEESRLRIGSFAGERDFDIVIVEGRKLTTLVDVLKNNTPEQ